MFHIFALIVEGGLIEGVAKKGFYRKLTCKKSCVFLFQFGYDFNALSQPACFANIFSSRFHTVLHENTINFSSRKETANTKHTGCARAFKP